MENQITIFIELNNSLRSIAKKLTTNFKDLNNQKKGYLAFVLAKATKSHLAVLLLCREGLGEDATIVCRSIFELMVQVKYILKDTTEVRLDRFFSYDWILRQKMFKKIEQDPNILEINGDTKEEIKNTIDAISINAELVNKKFNYNQDSWSDKSIRAMSIELDIFDTYEKVYFLQCEVAHSSIRTMNHYVKVENGELVVDAGPSHNFVKETLISTFYHYYEILSIINSELKLDLVQDFEKVEADFSSAIKNNYYVI